MRQRVISSTVGVLVMASSLLVACGGDGSSDSSDAGGSTGSTEFVGTYDIVSDAVVAHGLASTSAEMTGVAAAPETATPDAVLKVFENWGSYEGTIKQNQPDSYLTFEDALGAFKKGAENGDAVGMQTAISDFSTMATQYLATYPG
jgi:hypothetical protein